ncbi:MAG: glycosyl hydrolase family 28-related protein [Opitutales bacterium]
MKTLPLLTALLAGLTLPLISQGTLDTIADLQALTDPCDDTAVVVEGYHTPFDGGGGTFIWDAASTESENFGTVFEDSNGGTGRWIRLNDGQPINVRWFGAAGDNSTDDSLAFQRAINHLSDRPNFNIHETNTNVDKVVSKGARVLYIPTGTYAVNSLVVHNFNNVSLRGQGAILALNDPNRWILSWAPTTGGRNGTIYLEGIHFTAQVNNAIGVDYSIKAEIGDVSWDETGSFHTSLDKQIKPKFYGGLGDLAFFITSNNTTTVTYREGLENGDIFIIHDRFGNESEAPHLNQRSYKYTGQNNTTDQTNAANYEDLGTISTYSPYQHVGLVGAAAMAVVRDCYFTDLAAGMVYHNRGNFFGNWYGTANLENAIERCGFDRNLYDLVLAADEGATYLGNISIRDCYFTARKAAIATVGRASKISIEQCTSDQGGFGIVSVVGNLRARLIDNWFEKDKDFNLVKFANFSELGYNVDIPRVTNTSNVHINFSFGANSSVYEINGFDRAVHLRDFAVYECPDFSGEAISGRVFVDKGAQFIGPAIVSQSALWRSAILDISDDSTEDIYWEPSEFPILQFASSNKVGLTLRCPYPKTELDYARSNLLNGDPRLNTRPYLQGAANSSYTHTRIVPGGYREASHALQITGDSPSIWVNAIHNALAATDKRFVVLMYQAMVEDFSTESTVNLLSLTNASQFHVNAGDHGWHQVFSVVEGDTGASHFNNFLLANDDVVYRIQNMAMYATDHLEEVKALWYGDELPAGNTRAEVYPLDEVRRTLDWTTSGASRMVGAISQSNDTKHIEVIPEDTHFSVWVRAVGSDIENINVGDGSDATQYASNVTLPAERWVQVVTNATTDTTFQDTAELTLATQPTAGDTLILNDVTYTFVSGTPSGSEIAIGATLAQTQSNVRTALQAASDLTVGTWSANVITVTYDLAGAILTRAETFTSASNVFSDYAHAYRWGGANSPHYSALRRGQLWIQPTQTATMQLEVRVQKSELPMAAVTSL